MDCVANIKELNKALQKGMETFRKEGKRFAKAVSCIKIGACVSNSQTKR